MAQKLVALGVPIATHEVITTAAGGPTPLLEFVLSHPSITPEILNPPHSSNVIQKVLKVWVTYNAQYSTRFDPSKGAFLEKNIELLVDHGADVNKLDEYGQSPLMLLASYTPGSMLTTLLSQGTYPFSKISHKNLNMYLI